MPPLIFFIVSLAVSFAQSAPAQAADRMHGAAVTAAEAASLWNEHEISLTAEGTYQNPYKQGPFIQAAFDGPGGARKTVRGFWDGGRVFRVRFSPTRIGRWNYSIRSVPADRGLEKSGSLHVTAPNGGNRGFVRRSPEFPNSFRFDDGTPYFMMGNTYYSIVANAMGGGDWKKAVDGSAEHGINKIRLLVYPWPLRPHYPYPDSQPFMGDRLRPDRDRLRIEHWRKLDEIVRYLQS